MILRMMKKSRIVLALVCAMMVMMLATGCGEDKEAPIAVDLSSGNLQDEAGDLIQDTEEDKQNNDEGGDKLAGEDKQLDAEDKESGQTDGDRRSEADNSSQADDKEAGDNPSQIDDKSKGENSQTGQSSGNEELVGDIRGDIGQESFVLCKHTIESDGNVAIAVAAGAEEADDLVTVYVNPGCTYRYKKIKNGGINPEDISEREGSFGDLKEGMTCILKGSWQDGSFCADSIEMEEFV